jgi:hypothetical protein
LIFSFVISCAKLERLNRKNNPSRDEKRYFALSDLLYEL